MTTRDLSIVEKMAHRAFLQLNEFIDKRIKERCMSGLILTRRPGESVDIGDNVVVTVLAIKGNQARLHFKVPRSIPVHRREISERIKAELEHA